MKFRYKDYGSGVLRPVIPIELVHGHCVVPYEVLIDSGADLCVFDAQIGELLGLDITKGKKSGARGVTGEAKPFYIHTVTLVLGNNSHKIKAGFLPDMGESYGVVGQQGFFSSFSVKFDLRKEEISLTPR